MIAIYDHNDSGLHYKCLMISIYIDLYNKTTILANLALARSINYDHKVGCRVRRSFTFINYNLKTSIVQATETERD